MTTEITFTHKGWLGLCPVYIADLESDCPTLEPRHWVFEPLLDFSTLMFQFLGQFVEEPAFPLRITGELE